MLIKSQIDTQNVLTRDRLTVQRKVIDVRRRVTPICRRFCGSLYRIFFNQIIESEIYVAYVGGMQNIQKPHIVMRLIKQKPFQ